MNLTEVLEKVAYRSREEAQARTDAHRRGERQRVNVLVNTDSGRMGYNMPAERAADFIFEAEEKIRHLDNIEDRGKFAAVSHVETRLKKRQRGWHYEAEPGFHGVKSTFDQAEKNNKSNEVKLAAMLDALEKFALLDDNGDPIGTLSKILKENDFGFNSGAPSKKDRNRPQAESRSFGVPTGLGAGDAASRMSGFNSGGGYSGV